MRIDYIDISLDQVMLFYAKKCLKGRLQETFVDTSKNRVVFQLISDEGEKQ